MDYLLPTFQAVSVIFAIASVATGAQAILDPVSFSKSFGLPLSPTEIKSIVSPVNSSTTETYRSYQDHRNLAKSYVSLMGVRQLGTGIILLTFAYQGKWTEMGTILAIIGVVVAGTDGYYIAQGGSRGQGQFHAIPGALIAALAGAVLYSNT